MFTLHVKSIAKKHNEDHVFKDLEQVRRCLNQNYFQGLDIVKKNTLYSIASRPSTLKNCPYRGFITIQKLTKSDAWDARELSISLYILLKMMFHYYLKKKTRLMKRFCMLNNKQIGIKEWKRISRIINIFQIESSNKNMFV